MITLEASRESVLNKDDTEELETETETSDGTKNERRNSRRENETVLSDETGESAPYVIKELEPAIAGVVIACEGADDNTVAAAVTGGSAGSFWNISQSHSSSENGGSSMKKIFKSNQIAITSPGDHDRRGRLSEFYKIRSAVRRQLRCGGRIPRHH